jgi:hypothetical protein
MAIFQQLRFGDRKLLPDREKILVEFCKEVDVFVVAEKDVHIVSVSQDVATPTVQHCDL